MQLPAPARPRCPDGSRRALFLAALWRSLALAARTTPAAALALAMLPAPATAQSPPAEANCKVRSALKAPVVVELYTSEGCSSCPPADRWLSSLQGRPEVLALNFHVTYWDRLGWPDRFADPAYTQRQYDWARLHGSRQVYTPQVLVNGADWRRWPALPGPGGAAPVSVSLSRQGAQVVAEVSAAPLGTPRLAGFWAVLEDGHLTRVRAGENAGETLKHDHVVRLWRPVPAWSASLGTTSQLAVSAGDPRTPRRVAFVVIDDATRQPVQAVALAC